MKEHNNDELKFSKDIEKSGNMLVGDALDNELKKLNLSFPRD